jgi:hypothetical protein
MKMLFIGSCISLIMLMTAGCSRQSTKPPVESPVSRMLRRFAPTELSGDLSKLSPGDRQALNKLIEAARFMDRLYIRQVWSGNEALFDRLKLDMSVAGKERFQLLEIELSPWSSLDHDAAFVDGVPPRPPQADFYPPEMTREEFETWVGTLPPEEQQKANGFFYTIRRGADRKLTAVSYSQEYRDLLQPAASLLNEAAKLTDNPSLQNFLVKRANAFLTNEYYDSDVAWMDLDSPIELTIGPYETYMDKLFNYKAAFEAFVTLRNDAETSRLQKFSQYLQEIEDNLPIEKQYRNPKLGALAPIRVVDEVYVGGEAARGVQTAAFNLPNDERVVRAKGSKRVMLKNVQEAKFKHVLVPIAGFVLNKDQAASLAFEPFFSHILAHELMHGLGPQTITVAGKSTTVRQTMKELYSAIEEAKADIAGLFALQYLIDKGTLEKSMEQPLYVTFLASAFRSVRFGVDEAHGKGVALQFNYLTDAGAFQYEPATQTFKVNLEKVKGGVKRLTGEIMTLQAKGDYEAVKSMLEKYAVIRPEMKMILEKLSDVPVDIHPHFPVAQERTQR